MNPKRISSAVGLVDLLARPVVRTAALLALCAAYIQGGINKAMDFDAAVAEMQHFGVTPAVPVAIAVILLELGGSLLIILGKFRALAALALAGFTACATLLANRYWDVPMPERMMMANAFYEHIGLIGGFVLVAWHDLQHRR